MGKGKDRRRHGVNGAGIVGATLLGWVVVMVEWTHPPEPTCVPLSVCVCLWECGLFVGKETWGRMRDCGQALAK